MIKKIKDEMQVQCSMFSFFSCPFSLSSFSLMSLFFFTWSVIFFSCPPPPKDQHLSLTYSSLTLIIYKENMLTHQPSLKESICEKMFPITCIKICVAPCQLFSCYQQLHISKLQKMYFQNFTDTFNSWFCNLLL